MGGPSGCAESTEVSVLRLTLDSERPSTYDGSQYDEPKGYEVGNATRGGEPRRAVLADVHPVWLEAIARLIADDGVEVAAQCIPGAEALRAVEERRPDILITGLSVDGKPAAAGFEYIREARAAAADMKILVLAAEADAYAVEAALLAGADAYVVKTARPEDLLAAIRQTFDDSVFMLHGEVLADMRLPSRDGHVRDAKLDELTKREAEILRLVAEGLTNAQLARMLWLSEQTVKFHLSNIYRKLGVGNRTEASRWAQRHGALDEEADRVGTSASG